MAGSSPQLQPVLSIAEPHGRVGGVDLQLPHEAQNLNTEQLLAANCWAKTEAEFLRRKHLLSQKHSVGILNSPAHSPLINQEPTRRLDPGTE